jgi:hypothetical protein
VKLTNYFHIVLGSKNEWSATPFLNERELFMYVYGVRVVNTVRTAYLRNWSLIRNWQTLDIKGNF